MKSALLALSAIIIFSVSAFAQGGPGITLDLRPGLSDSSAEAGLTRSRLAAPTAPASATAAQVERQVFALLNAERRSQGLSELAWSDDVASVARVHSKNMADEKFFSHRGSDGSMVDDRADRMGLGAWNVIGENIAYMRGFENPAELAVQKWMESTAHRRNLLGPNWKESAVGVTITSDGTYYFTQVFLLRK